MSDVKTDDLVETKSDEKETKVAEVSISLHSLLEKDDCITLQEWVRDNKLTDLEINGNSENVDILTQALLLSAWNCVKVILTNYPELMDKLDKKNLGLINLKTAPSALVQMLEDRLLIEKKLFIESVTVSYGMTLNIGNYESFRCDAGATIRNIEGRAKTSEMFDEGWEVVSTQLREQVSKVRKKTKDKEDT